MYPADRNLSSRPDIWNRNPPRGRNPRSVFIPPSKAAVDPLPSRPTHYDSRQRVSRRVDRPVLKLYLHILPCGESKSTTSDDLSLQSMASSTAQSAKSYFLGKPATRPRKLGDRLGYSSVQPMLSPPPAASWLDARVDPHTCRDMYLALLDNQLTLADFRPLQAPFVPTVIKVLVNAIETDCHTASNWEPIFSHHSQLSDRADMHSCVLLQNWNDWHFLMHQITSLSLPMKIAVLRSILAGFKQKPLHFSRRLMMDVIQRPLFDQFLRPNPNMKSIVKRAVLPCNRTTMDTLSFIMLHLIHAWEYASNPLEAKLRLSKIYGPLLVSFAEQPVVLDQDPSDYKTGEGAILEVVLEECNGQFWDNMGMSQLRRAFAIRTTLESTAIERGRLSVMPTDVDSDNENDVWFSYLLRKQKKADKEGAGMGKKSMKESKRLSVKETIKKQSTEKGELDAASWMAQELVKDLESAVYVPAVKFLPCKEPTCR